MLISNKKKKKVDASLLNYRNVQSQQVTVYMIQICHIFIFWYSLFKQNWMLILCRPRITIVYGWFCQKKKIVYGWCLLKTLVIFERVIFVIIFRTIFFYFFYWSKIIEKERERESKNIMTPYNISDTLYLTPYKILHTCVLDVFWRERKKVIKKTETIYNIQYQMSKFWFWKHLD